MNHEEIHKAVRIAVKTAMVDREMIPLVNWLNSHDEVLTSGSCQGDDKPDKDGNLRMPAISFSCHDWIFLADILRQIANFNNSRPVIKGKVVDAREDVAYVDVGYVAEQQVPVVYTLGFTSRKAFKDFMKWVSIK